MMNKAAWLLLSTALLSIWNAAIVWFTQLAVYPLWPLVDSTHFHEFHLAWWHDMWPAFGPVGLMFFCSIALLWLRPAGVPRWMIWSGLVLQVSVHLLTALFWAPMQAAMATPTGMSVTKYQELMNTHWLRVALYLAFAGLTVAASIMALRRITQVGHASEARAIG